MAQNRKEEEKSISHEPEPGFDRTTKKQAEKGKGYKGNPENPEHPAYQKKHPYTN